MLLLLTALKMHMSIAHVHTNHTHAYIAHTECNNALHKAIVAVDGTR